MAIAAVVPVASSNWLEHHFSNLADKAGITINGSNPWDIQVHDRRTYRRVAFGGSLGLGEAYMDNWWDVPALDQFFYKVADSGLVDEVAGSPLALIGRAKAWLINEGAKRLAFDVGRAHYDLGNDLFEAMLDKRMVYTCGYWTEGVKTLDHAQEAKLDLICRKIGLKRGDRVLDIGCGWGSFAKFAAERYGASVVGITISEEQIPIARERCKAFPAVEIRFQDYRDIGMDERFDHIVSIGMFEHVGPKNYSTYFDVAARCLKPEGLFLLHCIGNNFSTMVGEPWLSKYVFPHGVLSSIAQIGKGIERRFVMEDWHNFGAHYDRTLMAWLANFEAAWPELKKKYDERFYRMWKYYLPSCAGLFRARRTQLWQITLSKKGVPGVYKTVR
jgi:cyclopropane-fatty-acyl-phospholipid synthase